MKRTVKTHTLAAAAALAVIAGVLGATAVRPASLHAAEVTYKLVKDWAQLPPGTSWGVMSAVAIDAKDNVYGFQRAEPSAKIMVFDARGKYVKSFGEGDFVYPHGLRVLRDGFIWATDRQMQQALKYDANGKLQWSLGQKNVKGDMAATSSFNGIADMAMTANGELFAADGEGGNSRIVKFSKDGKFIKTWGTKGAGPGQFSTPHCVETDPQGRIWVCDRGNKRLQVFDADGKFIDQMTQFGAPVSVIISKNNMMYVAAGEPENSVTIGTTDGKVLGKIENVGMVAPHGIAVDSKGAIYVSQSAGKAIFKFVKE